MQITRVEERITKYNQDIVIGVNGGTAHLHLYNLLSPVRPMTVEEQWNKALAHTPFKMLKRREHGYSVNAPLIRSDRTKRLYWYPDFANIDPLEVLYEKGFVIFYCFGG